MNTPKKKGLLLVNLGSPSAPEVPAVRKYLREFLTDPLVIDWPAGLRHLLVNAVIIPARVRASTEAYQKIWTEQGSPLIVNTQQLAAQLQPLLGETWEVRWAMRYGRPSMVSQLQNWSDIAELFVVPLYPQYAESSTETVIRELQRVQPAALNGKTRVLRDFYAEPEFTASYVHQIQKSLADFAADHLLLSFHGLPVHHLTKLHPQHCNRDVKCCERIGSQNENCYRAQCFATANEIFSQLSHKRYSCSVAFQSRLRGRPWISPFTDHEVERLADQGVRKILVACPSFTADCLETLEEVKMRLADQFRKAGGEELRLVPSLNSEAFWTQQLARMITRGTLRWNSL